MDNKPLVSIICPTYNQEKYIAQAIEGFIMQKTTFPFEVIIHDDASTDGTAEIIKEFEKKFPDIIKPIYQTVNQFSIGVKRVISTHCLPKSQGKYIALCDGDDYWIDPLKLQKQIDFLETNTDYSIVHTNYKVYVQKNNTFKTAPLMRKYNGWVFNKLLYNNFLSTLTVCYRKELYYKIDFNNYDKQNFTIGDLPIWIELSRLGKFYFLEDITGVYRQLDKSLMHGALIKEIKVRWGLVSISKYFMNKYQIKNIQIKTFFVIVFHSMSIIQFLIFKFVKKIIRRY